MMTAARAIEARGMQIPPEDVGPSRPRASGVQYLIVERSYTLDSVSLSPYMLAVGLPNRGPEAFLGRHGRDTDAQAEVVGEAPRSHTLPVERRPSAPAALDLASSSLQDSSSRNSSPPHLIA